MPGQRELSAKLLKNKFRTTWDDEDSSLDCDELKRQRLFALVVWNPRNKREFSSSSSRSSYGSPVVSASNKNKEPEANNSAQGLNIFNLPSQAEVLADQKNWMSVYFRYRIKWHQAKPHLQKMSKRDAYLPENLKLWTRCVKVSLQRKVPIINAVRVFNNRIRCPDIMLRYTLNSFYWKGCESVKKHTEPLQYIPVVLPLFRCPDDIPEIKKMSVATMDIFVTTEGAFFDDFWNECLGGY